LLESRFEIVTGFAEWLRPLGPFNFVYTDGDTLFVHSHRRVQSDGEVRPPGLHLLVRSCDEEAIDLSQSGIMMAPTAQELALVASVPLTDEPWEPIAEGEVIALKGGLVRARKAAASAKH
jgi:glutamine amidotransferase